MDKNIVCSKKSSKELFWESIYYIVGFYSLIWIASFFLTKYYNLEQIFWIIFLGNLGIAILTQFLHYFSEKNNNSGNEFEKFAFTGWPDCTVRCLAGILEMIFYTITLAIYAGFLIAGYFIMKSLSVWQSKKEPEKEGRHTAVHRIAVVLSLIISLFSAYYLNKYLFGEATLIEFLKGFKIN
jgi:hypothetical protein